MASRVILRAKKLSEHATLPVRASAGAAGYDLCSAEDGVVPARGKALMKTDLAIAVPADMYGRVGETAPQIAAFVLTSPIEAFCFFS